YAAVLIEPDGVADGGMGVAGVLASIATLPGAIPIVQVADASGQYRADWLVAEQSIAINTTAAGGNASLMAMV
ncbi:MAG: hypothetical protein ACKOUM_02335, partial [Sphingopyxis sp.]